VRQGIRELDFGPDGLLLGDIRYIGDGALQKEDAESKLCAFGQRLEVTADTLDSGYS